MNTWQQTKTLWRGRLNRYFPSEAMLIFSAIVVGGLTGLAAVFFISFLGWIHHYNQLINDRFSIPGMLLFMVIAGLIVGYLIDRYAREAKGHGVPEVMEAIALYGGRIRAPVALIKVIASSITIGAGGSAGREGPIVQVGSTLGSIFGQKLHLSEDRVRTLVACGAAAGIAATFNAPIAGAIFALEVILDRFSVRHFGMVVLSAVSASITGRVFLGNQPAFAVPAYPLNHLGELPLYIFLGGVSALVAVAFIRLLYAVEGFFDRWSIPLAYKTALGLMLTGGVALLLPGREVLGPGLELIGETIATDIDISITFLVALLVLKLVATTLTLGSGNSGGVFAPSLFMGAVLGGIVGSAGRLLFPGIVIDPGAYAIVGMAAVFSGAARAPITAVLIVFEMSGDYKLILPLMLATILSTFLAEYLFPESIYTFKLKLKGVELDRGRDEDILHSVSVAEVMSPKQETISCDATLNELSERLQLTHRHGFPVTSEEDRLMGIVTITDLSSAIQRDTPGNTPVQQICTPRDKLVICHPDESIGTALKRMATFGYGHLPVVAEIDSDKLIGIVRRADIVDAYRIAVNRRAALQHRTKQIKVNNLDGTQFAEFELHEGDQAVGQSIRALAPALPADCVLVSIRRGGRLVIPHGDTVLAAGDLVTTFVTEKTREEVGRVFRMGKVEQP